MSIVLILVSIQAMVVATLLNEDANLFGGVLAGSLIGAVAGVFHAAVSSKRQPWQIYASRLFGNFFGGVIFGIIAALVGIGKLGMTPSLPFFVACGGIGGLVGVAGLMLFVEGKILRRLRKEEESPFDLSRLPPLKNPTVITLPSRRRATDELEK